MNMDLEKENAIDQSYSKPPGRKRLNKIDQLDRSCRIGSLVLYLQSFSFEIFL